MRGFRDDPIPRLALWLGAAGLLPFAAGALAAWLVPDWMPVAAPAGYGLVVYGALILSFLGGTHWGLASTVRPPDPLLGWSVIPSLVGWAACFLSVPLAIPLLVAAFLAVLVFDWRASRGGLAPEWWWRLRLMLTIAVVLLLAAAGAGYVRAGLLVDL